MKLFITSLVLLCCLAITAENHGAAKNNSHGQTHIAFYKVVNRFFTWYLDADTDGYWVTAKISNISPGVGWTRTQPGGGMGDCNDADPTVHSLIRYYRDNDGDGLGSENINVSVLLCTSTAPAGFSGNNLDCDDTDPGKKAFVTWFKDSDGDSYGTPDISVKLCPLTVPLGYVPNNFDCNDANGAINPGTLWYKDADNDLFYTGVAIRQCLSPGTDYRRNGFLGGGDCNDNNASVHPNTLWFLDADDDKYFADTIRQCVSPGAGYRRTGTILGGEDCDDDNTSVNPGTYEICGDGLDNNCNGQIDESTIQLSVSPGTGIHTVCRGGSLFLSAFSNTAVRYQWMKGRQDLAGETGNTLIVSRAGDYKVKVTDARNCTATSGVFTILIVTCVNGAITETALTRIENTTREKLMSIAVDEVKVLPNPTSDEFSFLLPHRDMTEPVTILVYNSSLQIVQPVKRIEGSAIKLGKDLKAGIYYAELRCGNKRTVLKLVKL